MNQSYIDLPLTEIRTDGGTQARAHVDQETIWEYQDAMIDGATFPPVLVFYDGESYWLADGFHRVTAARNIHRQNPGAYPATIAAEVCSGTRREAVLYAVGANAAHGLKRTREDVQRAIMLLLRDQEWSQWSDREIARLCRCDHKTVGAQRKRLEATGELPSTGSDRKTANGRIINIAPIAAANAERKAAVLPDRVEPGAIHPFVAAVLDPPPQRATAQLADWTMQQARPQPADQQLCEDWATAISDAQKRLWSARSRANRLDARQAAFEILAVLIEPHERVVIVAE